jgi:hypothetical protein
MKKPARKRPSKPRPKKQMIVLVDSAGNYYEFPRATLERCRVSDRRKKEVEAAFEPILQRWSYIPGTAIPGSVAAPSFVELRYAGFYLR